MASSEFKLPRNFVWTQGSANLKQFAETLTPLLPPAGASTLQQVLDNNHDLVDGNNFQGTGAGLDNTGTQVIAIGDGAGAYNTADGNIFIGNDAGGSNTGTNSIMIGASAGNGNLSTRCVIIGHTAGLNNEGVNSVILGVEAGQGNAISGSFIIGNYSLPSYLDYAAADAAISGSGAAGNTYLYHDQTTNSIGAVRL
jgi:hypothetical protein